MTASGPGRGTVEQGHDAVETIRRAFREFLAVPMLMIVGFLLLAAGTSALDHGQVAWLDPAHAFLKARVFADAKATSDLLSIVAGGIITVTSITISLLLLALQQVAASLTDVVYDQFLRRRHNQVYFGFFVGLALYALVTLATVTEGFNPRLRRDAGLSAHHRRALAPHRPALHHDQPDAAGGSH